MSIEALHRKRKCNTKSKTLAPSRIGSVLGSSPHRSRAPSSYCIQMGINDDLLQLLDADDGLAEERFRAEEAFEDHKYWADEKDLATSSPTAAPTSNQTAASTNNPTAASKFGPDEAIPDWLAEIKEYKKNSESNEKHYDKRAKKFRTLSDFEVAAHRKPRQASR